MMNGHAEGAGAGVVATLSPDPGVAAAAAAAAAASPQIQQLNVTQKSRMHIGPKFVSVTQNVHNVEVVKETGLGRYIWEWAKRTSRAERLAFAAALAALVVCATLLAVVLTQRGATVEPPDVAPHEWNITREMWLSKERPSTPEPLEVAFVPPRVVIVQHTAGPECHRFADCAAVMRNLQSWFLSDYKEDIPYNFLIGNDGRVYEGRGWGVFGAHTVTYNRCAIGLGFTGDYRTITTGSRVTELQLKHALLLLASGVAAGHLHERYVVFGASDLQRTVSPGDNLYQALNKWSHFARNATGFFNRTCEFIYEALREEDAASVTHPLS